MRNILSPNNRPVLEQFAFSNALLAFDYDGTLAPIVSHPDRARMRPRTKQLLTALTELYPCAVISGRARADTRARMNGVPMRSVVGNHGAETERGLNGFSVQVQRWRLLLTEQLGDLKGVTIEDKAHSLAIHYRAARQKRKARTAALRAVSSLGPVRIIGGKQVINVMPRGAPHKGVALERERDRLRCDTAIYVGDDDTDEDVFGLDQPGRLLTIRVGAKRGSLAAYFIRDQRQMDVLLALLARLRAPR